jgi:hypothetical protein
MKIDHKTFIAQLILSNNFDNMEQGLANGCILHIMRDNNHEMDAQVDTVDYEWVSRVSHEDGRCDYTASK